MPAAAVIPAPIAYIKVVAVKTSVVERLPVVQASHHSVVEFGLGLGTKSRWLESLMGLKSIH